MASVMCVACAQSLPNSRDRRRLQNETDRQTLGEVISRVYPGAVSVFLPPRGLTIVCRGCFARLEKLQKLRAEARSLDAALESGVRRYGELVGVAGSSTHEASTARSPSATPGRVRKRPCPSPVSRPQAKRRLMETPSRRFMMQTQACDSPAVAVSFCVSNCNNYIILDLLLMLHL